MREIVGSMIDPIADENGNLSIERFKKFLDLNPTMKTMV